MFKEVMNSKEDDFKIPFLYRTYLLHRQIHPVEEAYGKENLCNRFIYPPLEERVFSKVRFSSIALDKSNVKLGKIINSKLHLE